jgi:hypothetical protein
MNKKPKVKNKVLQIRCTQGFLDTVDELRSAFGMNRTELIEYLVQYLPTITGQNKDGNDT